MNKSPITLDEIKELEQIVYDLKAMQSIFAEHTKRVEAIIKKYTITKSEAALKKEEERRQSKLNVEMGMVAYRERWEINRKKKRIKYLKANPEPGGEREILQLEASLRAIGKLK